MNRTSLRQWAAVVLVILSGVTCGALSVKAAQARRTKIHLLLVSAPPVEGDLLTADARLAVKVTLQKQDAEVGSALDQLGSLGHVKLISKLSLPGRVSFSYHDTRLRDIMDSMACAAHGEWRRGPASSYVIAPAYDPHGLDPLRPHTQAEADEDAAGRPLPGELQQLSPQATQALETGEDQETPNHPAGIAFSALPSAMQATLSQMQQAQVRVLVEQGFPPFQNNDITKTRITLRKDDSNEYTRYHIGFILPPKVVDGLAYSNSGTYEANTTAYKDPRDQDHGVVPADAARETGKDDAQADAASRRAAIATDPALKQRVSLTTDLASLSDALTALSAKAGIAFADEEQADPALRSLSYKDVPLSDVLDGLAARCTTDTLRCSWGERPSGVIVFHLGFTTQGREAMQAKLTAMIPQIQAEMAQAAAERAAKSNSGNSGGQ